MVRGEAAPEGGAEALAHGGEVGREQRIPALEQARAEEASEGVAVGLAAVAHEEQLVDAATVDDEVLGGRVEAERVEGGPQDAVEAGRAEEEPVEARDHLGVGVEYGRDVGLVEAGDHDAVDLARGERGEPVARAQLEAVAEGAAQAGAAGGGAGSGARLSLDADGPQGRAAGEQGIEEGAAIVADVGERAGVDGDGGGEGFEAGTQAFSVSSGRV